MAEATARELRRANLAAVLSLVHDRGTVSRAELTRETGLNRSTVGALVGELVHLRLVRESERVPESRIGRPSLLIEPERSTVALAVHLRADAVTIGVVGVGGEVIRRIRYRTEQAPGAGEVVDIVAAVVAGLGSELDVVYSTIGAGVAVPGVVRTRDGGVDAPARLGWHAEPLAERLEHALRMPVHAAGEATVGLLGETAFGVARGVRNAVFLSAEEGGIRAAVLGDGALLRGAEGYAGALGHLLVNSDGALCECGARGCLDTEVSEEALRVAGPDAVLDALAVGVRTMVNVVDPELVVLDGFLGALHEGAPERLPAALARAGVLRRGSDRARGGVRVSAASRGSDLVLLGAGQLAFDRLLRDPGRLATLRAAAG